MLTVLAMVLQEELMASCEKEKIFFRILVDLGNAPDHSPNVSGLSETVKMLFHHHPNATLLLQLTDKEVIANFKIHYLHQTFFRLSGYCDSDDKLSSKEFWCRGTSEW
jgi:hypothetical protein